MNNIFLGFIFVLFDFSLTFGNSSISLVPSCIGFWFIGKDLVTLAPKSATLAKTIPWAKAMMIATAVTWVLNALGIGSGILGAGAGILVMLINLYVTYSVVTGIKEVEDYHQSNLRAEELKKAWLMSTVVSLAGTVAALIIPMIGMVIVVAGIVLNVYFMTCMNNTKKLYAMIPPTASNYGEEI